MSSRPLRTRPVPQLGKGTKTIYEQAADAASSLSATLGMTPTKASGATRWASQKTDAQNRFYRMEHKYTTRKSFAVSVELLTKLFLQANVAEPRDPVFSLTFCQLDGSRVPADWVLIPARVFEDLCQREVRDGD